MKIRATELEVYIQRWYKGSSYFVIKYRLPKQFFFRTVKDEFIRNSLIFRKPYRQDRTFDYQTAKEKAEEMTVESILYTERRQKIEEQREKEKQRSIYSLCKERIK